MKQRFTSKQTSINSTKAPAVYSMKKAVNVMTGKTVVDIGGALPGWNVARFGRLIQATQKR